MLTRDIVYYVLITFLLSACGSVAQTALSVTTTPARTVVEILPSPSYQPKSLPSPTSGVTRTQVSTITPAILATSTLVSPTSTPSPAATLDPSQDIMLSLISYPGDGGWCQADYLGLTAPSVVLYRDGRLMLEHGHESTYWYTQRLLDQNEVAAWMGMIEATGYFAFPGDGYKGYDDPIYRLPEGFNKSYGASTLSLQVNWLDLSKQASIYSPYLDYLVPEIAGALQIVKQYQPQGMMPYNPQNWIVWAGREHPCEYPIQGDGWPGSLPSIPDLLAGQKFGRFMLSETTQSSLLDILGYHPREYVYQHEKITYYVIVRPLLPHEVAEEFNEEGW